MAADDDPPLRRPSQPKTRFEPPDLSAFSVLELAAYVDQLKAEIERAEAELRSRQSVRGAAEALFKPRG